MVKRRVFVFLTDLLLHKHFWFERQNAIIALACHDVIALLVQRPSNEIWLNS